MKYSAEPFSAPRPPAVTSLLGAPGADAPLPALRPYAPIAALVGAVDADRLKARSIGSSRSEPVTISRKRPLEVAWRLRGA